MTTCCRSSKPGWRPRIYSTANPGGVGHAWYRAKFITPRYVVPHSCRSQSPSSQVEIRTSPLPDCVFIPVSLRPANTDRVQGWAKLLRILEDPAAKIRQKIFI